MIYFRLGTTLAFAAMFLLTHAPALKAQAAQPSTQTGPVWTPYQRNPFLFTNAQQAIQALDSPDMLMRRSGVEWLGQWTGIYATYGVMPNKANCDSLQVLPLLVPRLTRAVREMPDEDSQQAARLLVQIGPPARSAVPAVCEALVKQGSTNVFKRYYVLASLVHLCGGADAVAPRLAALLQDHDPQTRCAAAGAAGLCDDIGFNHIGPDTGGGDILSPSQSPVANIKLRAEIMSALTSRVDDPVTAVRLAALKSLEALTYGSEDACLITWQQAFDASWQKKFEDLWQNTLPPLARAVASPDPAVRLAAVRVLAYMPGDVSPLSPALRGELHNGGDERTYALAALCHAAETNRTLVETVFLKDLSSGDLIQRRQAAADVRLTVMPLWDGGFFPDHEPLPWFNDARLFATTPSSLPGLSPSQRDVEQKRRQAAQEEAQPRLLAALVQGTSDPDQSVRAGAASSLELIGQWAESASAHGFYFEPKLTSGLTVKKALAQAAENLNTTEPALSVRLRDLNANVWGRPQPLFTQLQRK